MQFSHIHDLNGINAFIKLDVVIKFKYYLCIAGKLPVLPPLSFISVILGISRLITVYMEEIHLLSLKILQPPFISVFSHFISSLTKFRPWERLSSEDDDDENNDDDDDDPSDEDMVTVIKQLFYALSCIPAALVEEIKGCGMSSGLPHLSSDLYRQLLSSSKDILAASADMTLQWSDELRTAMRSTAVVCSSITGTSYLVTLKQSDRPYYLAFFEPLNGLFIESVEVFVSGWTALIKNPCNWQNEFQHCATAASQSFLSGSYRAFAGSEGVLERAANLGMVLGINEGISILRLVERLGNISAIGPLVIEHTPESADKIISMVFNSTQLGYGCASLLTYCGNAADAVARQRNIQASPELRAAIARLKVPASSTVRAWSQAMRALCLAPLETWKASIRDPVPSPPEESLRKTFDCFHTLFEQLIIFNNRSGTGALSTVLQAMVLEYIDVACVVPQKFYKKVGGAAGQFFGAVYSSDIDMVVGLDARDLPGLRQLVDICASVSGGGQSRQQRRAEQRLFVGNFKPKPLKETKKNLETLVKRLETAGDQDGYVEREVARADALHVLPCSRLGCGTMRQYGEERIPAKLCAQCQCVRYCSGKCQKKDWKEHKVVCKLLAEQRSAIGAV